MDLTFTGILFTAKRFYNLFLPLPIQPHSMMLCAWLDLHSTVVLHYGPWVSLLHLYDFCGQNLFSQLLFSMKCNTI